MKWVIETKRLLLRRQTVDDAEFILKLVNDPDWLRYIGDRGVCTAEDARAYIEAGCIKMYEKYGFGLYLMELRNERTPLGICGLIKRDLLEDVDLGFALVREHRGKGYAREAATATIAYSRDTLGLDRITAIVAPGNASSVRLLESLGFSFDYKYRNPDGSDVHLFALEL